MAAASMPGFPALSGVPATLLMTLAARARAPAEAPRLGFRDPDAERILARLGGDPHALCALRTSLMAILLRDRWCDARAAAFFRAYPSGLGVNVGAGLNTNYERLMAAGILPGHWVDADLPESIALRRHFFTDTATRSMVAADATQPDFFDRLGWAQGQRALFVIEGVLPYLPPAAAEGFFRALGQAADARNAPVEIAFDYAHPRFVRRSAAHPDLKSRATAFHWGLTRPQALAAIDPRLDVVGEYDYFSRRGRIDFLRGLWLALTTGGEKMLACAHLARAPA